MYSENLSCQTSARKPPPDLYSVTAGNGALEESAIRPHVCIVDDDEAMREALVMLIESMGWEVDAFDSAEAFMDNYPARQDFCLILDLQMPGMSGADLLERLHGENRNIPVIVITAFPENNLARRALAAGALEVLTKPFNDQYLLEEIYRALDPDV